MSINFALALSLLNMTTMRAGRVVLALYALDLGAAPLTVGLLAATFSVFPALLSWPAGRLVDRFGSRWVLTIGALGGGLGMLIPFFVPGLTAIFFAAAANGLSLAIYNVSLQNLVGLLSTPQNRTQSFSNYSLTNSIGSFVGPLIAGFGIQHGGHAATCLALAVMSLLPLVALAILGRRMPHGAGRKPRSDTSIRGMLRARGVGRTLATSSLLQSGQDLFQFYLPVYAHGIGLSASAIGVVLAMNSAAAFVVRLVLPRLIARFNEGRVLAGAFLGGAAAFMLLPFFTSAVTLAMIAFAFGLGMGCGQPIVTMQMFTNSAEGRSGEALGLRMTVNHLTRVVGPVLFGVIGSSFGLAAVFWINGLMLGGGSAITRGASSNSQTDKLGV
jgi:MFS family permease